MKDTRILFIGQIFSFLLDKAEAKFRYGGYIF